MEEITVWVLCDDKGCPQHHGFDTDMLRRHRLPDEHPTVVAARAAWPALAPEPRWSPRSDTVHRYLNEHGD